MDLTLHIWRQAQDEAKGRFVAYEVTDISEHMSFLEMLDVLNERLIREGEDPVAFDHDCREGICGMCGMVINGRPHGPLEKTTACQLHMRHFTDGQEVWIEPWRATAFPVIRDLIVDRTAFDRIVQAGGYISVNTGAAAEANSVPVPKENADLSFEAAECIACGACVAACPNASAMLFTAAFVEKLNLLPHGQPERDQRTVSMVAAMNEEHFGHCTNHGACENACPKGISLDYIARLNRDVLKAKFRKPGGVVE